jgi:hypothetical protein
VIRERLSGIVRLGVNRVGELLQSCSSHGDAFSLLNGPHLDVAQRKQKPRLFLSAATAVVFVFLTAKEPSPT